MIGFGVGWLLGMSASPVLHLVVSSIIALVGAVVGALAGIHAESAVSNQKDTPEPPITGNGSHAPDSPKSRLRPLNVNPMPLGVLVVGILVGSCVGVYVRTNDWLGPDPQRLALRWSGGGLTEAQIRMRLFDQLYPAFEAHQALLGHTDSPVVNSHLPVLFGLSIEECQLLQGKRGAELRDNLKLLSNPDLATITARCNEDEDCLEAIRRVVCPVKQ